MLQNWSHRYSSCIVKFVGFELTYYVINLSVVSSFMVFNNLVSMFSIDLLLVSINKIISFKKKKKK